MLDKELSKVILEYGSGLKRGFLRGGNWNNTDNAGAFALNLNNTPDNRNNNIGFRCASDLVSSVAGDMRLRTHIQGH